MVVPHESLKEGFTKEFGLVVKMYGWMCKDPSAMVLEKKKKTRLSFVPTMQIN